MTSASTSLTLPSIALCGKMGAGKTTVAEFLEKTFNYHRVSVARAIRELAIELYGPEAENNREILQALGQDLRKHDPNVWTNMACKRIDRIKNGFVAGPLRIVVDDMRFPSEWQAFKERDFRIIEVIADRNQRVERLRANGKLTDESQLEHPTETALDDTGEYSRDAVLTNYSGKYDLNEQVMDLLKKEVGRS